MLEGFSTFRRSATRQLSDYFLLELAAEPARDRAWTKVARPRLARRARAVRALSARGDYGASLLQLREVARALEQAGYVPRTADLPLFELERPLDAFDSLTPAEAEERVAALEPILERLVDLAGATPKALKYRRLALWGGLAIALLLLAVAALRPSGNLALHRPVSASSSAFDTRPEGAVDGFRYGQLGFHSNEERGAWLLIDLQAPHDLTQVVAFGRADCCFSQSIPLWLEASLDGRHFERVAETNQPFSQFEPWRVKPRRPLRARYLRFKTATRALLVLSEVEAFGP